MFLKSTRTSAQYKYSVAQLRESDPNITVQDRHKEAIRAPTLYKGITARIPIFDYQNGMRHKTSGTSASGELRVCYLAQLQYLCFDSVESASAHDEGPTI